MNVRRAVGNRTFGKEFALLAYLSLSSGNAQPRRLLDAVWGYENYPNTRTVDTHIVHLRQKLEPNPEETLSSYRPRQRVINSSASTVKTLRSVSIVAVISK